MKTMREPYRKAKLNQATQIFITVYKKLNFEGRGVCSVEKDRESSYNIMLVLNLKRGLLLSLTIFLMLGIGGCATSDERNEPNVPNAQPPSLMLNNRLYYSTGESVLIDVTEKDYLGRITSVVNLSQKPTKNGQANIPFKGAPYTEYEEGFVLLMDGEWIFFESR